MNVGARYAQIRELAVRQALELRLGPAITLPARVTGLYEIEHGHSPWIDWLVGCFNTTVFRCDAAKRVLQILHNSNYMR